MLRKTIYNEICFIISRFNNTLSSCWLTEHFPIMPQSTVAPQYALCYHKVEQKAKEVDYSLSVMQRELPIALYCAAVEVTGGQKIEDCWPTLFHFKAEWMLNETMFKWGFAVSLYGIEAFATLSVHYLIKRYCKCVVTYAFCFFLCVSQHFLESSHW